MKKIRYIKSMQNRAFFWLAMGVLLLVFSSATLSQAPSLTVSKYMFAADPGLSPQQALESDDWQAVDNFENYGFSQQSYWLKIDLKNASDQELNRVLRAVYPLHDIINFNEFRNGHLIRSSRQGDEIEGLVKEVDIIWPAIHLNLLAGEATTVLVELSSHNSLILGIALESEADVNNKVTRHYLILGGVLGTLLVMGFYNLFLAIFARDTDYLIYVWYVFSYFFFVLALTGEGYYLFWPHAYYLNDILIQLTAGILLFPMLLFPYRILDIPKNLPSWKSFYLGMMAIGVVYFFSIFVTTPELSTAIINAISILLNIPVFFTAAYLAYKGIPIARIYTIGWSFLFIGLAILSAGSMGWLPTNDLTRSAYMYAGMFELIVLSIALARRIELERIQKLDALEKASHAMEQASDAEHKASLSEQAMRQLFNESPVGIIRFNREGLIDAANPAFAALVGVHLDDLMARKNFNLFEFLNDHHMLSSRLKHEIEVNDQEVQLMQGKGVRDCAISIVSLHDDPDRFQAYLVDIAERKRAQRIKAELEAKRINSLEHLVTGIAHEINTPLGVTITSLSALDEDVRVLKQKFEQGSLSKNDFVRSIDKKNQSVGLMQASLNRIGMLVERFKSTSLGQLSTATKSLRFSEYLEDCQNYVSGYYSSVDLDVECSTVSDDGVMHNANTNALDAIFRELIDNAVIHSGIDKAELKLCFSIIEHEQVIEFVLKDNGRGIGETTLEQISQPFYTTLKGSESNAGLGLYHVFNIVTQVFNGQLSMQNDDGLTVKIIIPKAPQLAEVIPIEQYSNQ